MNSFTEQALNAEPLESLVTAQPAMATDSLQTEAIGMCCDLNKRVVAITGQAGTGKTTIIKQAINKLQEAGIRAVICAPTGKAARRIKEATGMPALTIHKLLEYPRPGEYDEKTGKPLDTGVPKRCRSNPLSWPVVFVDEYAMVNYELHNNLLAALPRGGAIRCFGDVNQLPPIEDNDRKSERTPFEKLLEEQPSVTLETVFRQAEGSEVLAAATNIKLGRMPHRGTDFNYIITHQPVKALKELVLDMEEEGCDYRTIQHQIITPGNKTWVGTYAINSMLRSLLNPKPAEELQLPREKWQEAFPVRIGIGDKVVCNENTYDLRDYEERYEAWLEDGKPDLHSFIPTPDTKQMLNGETGIVKEIFPDGGIEIDFGDRVVEIPASYYEYSDRNDTMFKADARKKLGLAYALTTHKCQGSEFTSVIYVLNRSLSFVQGRENFYTAVTRAKKLVRVLCDNQSLSNSVRNKTKRGK